MKFKELAKNLCEREGKKESVNIAQMSEILSCLGAEFATMGILETVDTVDNLVGAWLDTISTDESHYGREPLVLVKPKKRKKK